MRLRRHREPCATKAEASFTHSIRWREDQCLQVSPSVWSAAACRRFRTRAELRPLQMIMNASAKTPRALRKQSGSKLHALHTLARGSMLTGFAKRLECCGLPALLDRTELRPLQTVITASAKTPRALRNQSGSKLHALHTLARGSMLTGFAKRLECCGLAALLDGTELRPLQTVITASAKTPRALRNQSGSKLHALHTLARGSMLTGFAKRLECSGLPALSDGTESRPLQTVITASAKTPRALRNQSGSKLHALHTLARGSMLTGFAKRLECSGLPALSDLSRIATIANDHESAAAFE